MKLLHRAAWLVALALACGASPAYAQITWWTVSGTFADNATFSGSFAYDIGADSYSNFQITTTSGSLIGATYSSAAGAFTMTGGGRDVIFSAADQSRYIGFDFSAPLTASSPSVAIDTSSGYSYECYNCNPFRLIASGQAALATPEPAAWAMMIGGFALSGAALRRRRRMARAFA